MSVPVGGLQVNKFEQVSSLGHYMSQAQGQGSLYSEIPCPGGTGRIHASKQAVYILK